MDCAPDAAEDCLDPSYGLSRRALFLASVDSGVLDVEKRFIASPARSHSALMPFGIIWNIRSNAMIFL